jgi:hypothetical protein
MRTRIVLLVIACTGVGAICVYYLASIAMSALFK